MIDGTPGMHEHHSEVNELARGHTDHVDPQNRLRFTVEDQFEQAFVPHDLATWGLACSSDADLVGEALISALFLC
jgi:hypothetical protein